MGTFDDNRRTHAARTGAFRRVGSRSPRRPRDLGLRRRVERFPFVPSDPARLEQDCYEAYNIQVAGLQQRLEAIGAPKVVIGVSGGLDSTHALIVAAKAMDRAGRPADRHPRLHAPRLRHLRRDEGERARAHARARRSPRRSSTSGRRPADARRARATRSRAARRSTTSRSRTSRPACAPTTCSGSPTSAAGSCSAPATSPSSRSAGRRTASATR